MKDKKNISVLIAPLDWGLGHATRCIPIISNLINSGCKVVIATEGVQENLLKREFPELHFVHLDGYRILYAKRKRWFSLKILLQLPKIWSAIKKEKRWLDDYLQHSPVDLIISDNRYGLYHRKIPCVIMTHQLQIKAPFALAENLMQKIHYKMLEKFSDCWVPDNQGEPNIAGTLSNPAKMPAIPVTYLGPLSRFNETKEVEVDIFLLIVLSGPEPQRFMLEQLLISQLKSFSKKAMLVRGLPQTSEAVVINSNVTVKNHLTAVELESAFLRSEYIVSRSGYTTVMDIIKLKKRAILIPTPGQTEQEYLATHLCQQGWCMASVQENVNIQNLIQKAAMFEFKKPEIEMDSYQKTIIEFISNRFP